MCRKCKANTVFVLINGRKLCKKCFCKYFEKKIFYTIRKYNFLKKYGSIFIEKAKYSEILKYIFRTSVYKIKKNKQVNKILLSTSADDIAIEIILNQLSTKKEIKELLPKQKNKIKPFYLLLDKEILLYAKLKGLKINKEKEKDELTKKVRTFINDLEKKHPEIKYAVVNGFLQILPAL